MPPTRSEPPPVMTWPKAAPVLGAAGVFFALRFFFEWFVFLGPALAAAACTAAGNNSFLSWFGSLGTKVSATLCSVGAAVLGSFSFPVSYLFGTIMAMAVGFGGMLLVSIYIMSSNGRLFKEDARAWLWLGGGFLLSEVPFIGSFPSLFGAVWLLYTSQIKRDQAAYAAWEEQERARTQAMRLAAQQAAYDAQSAARREAANDAQYTQDEQEAA